MELSSYETRADGTFRVPDDLSNSTVRLRFVDGRGRALTEFYDGAADLASATDIEVGASTVDLGDVGLSTASHITGHLTGESGEPVTRGVVTAWTGSPGAWDLVSRADTDSAGFYDVGGLPEGAYRLRFQDYSGERAEEVYADAASLDEGRDVAVGPLEVVPGIDAVLATHSTLYGRVVDAAGVGVRGIWVRSWTQVDGQWQRVATGHGTTDRDGWYVIYGLTEGAYRLELQDDSGAWLHEFYDDSPDLAGATTVDLPHATELAVGDATVDHAAGISGDVTDPAGEQAQARVSAWREVDGTWTEVAHDTTDHAGHYDILGLSAGRYVLGFDTDGDLVDQFHPDAVSIGDAVPIDLADGQHREVDAELAEAAFTAIGAPALARYGDPTTEPNNAGIDADWATWSAWPDSRSWQWYRDGVPVPGQGDRYDLSPDDLGASITVVETAVSRFGTVATSRSAALVVPTATPTPPTHPDAYPDPDSHLDAHSDLDAHPDLDAHLDAHAHSAADARGPVGPRTRGRAQPDGTRPRRNGAARAPRELAGRWGHAARPLVRRREQAARRGRAPAPHRPPPRRLADRGPRRGACRGPRAVATPVPRARLSGAAQPCSAR